MEQASTPENKEELLKIQEDSSDKILISRGTRWYVFALFNLMMMFTALDQGVIPTAANVINEDFSFTDTQFGLFCSLFAFGKTCGSLAFIVLINVIHRKVIIISSLITIASSSFLLTCTNFVPLLYSFRVAHGFFQIFYIIYFPVWCDQFGIRNKKILMITIIQISYPLGVMVGSFSSTFIHWKFVMRLEAIITSLICVAFIFVDRNILSSIIFKQGQPTVSKPSIYSENTTNSSKKDEKKNGDSILSMFTNKFFIFCLLSRSLNYFPSAAMSTWTIPYMEYVLGITDKRVRLLCFSILGTLSPSLGTIVGGTVGTLIGGYENKNAGIACVIIYLANCVTAVIIPLLNNVWVFTFTYAISLISSIALIPILTGIILSSVPNTIRGSAGSVACFSANFIAFTPAPFIYGLINDNYKQASPRLAITVTFYVSFACIFFLILTAITHYTKRKNEENSLTSSNETNVNGSQKNGENNIPDSIPLSDSNKVTISLKDKITSQ